MKSLRPALGKSLVPSIFRDGHRYSNAITMPSGAMALWNMDEYTATPTPRIPNSLASGTPLNLMGATTRRLFTSTKGGWTASGTVADAGLSGPDGSSDASTFTAAGDCLLYPAVNPTLAAGTYTIAIRVKRNTGTDQLFKLSFFTAANHSATKTATSSWQWFTHTATVGAGSQWIMALISYDRATGMNVQMMDAMLLAGTVTDTAVLDAAAAASIRGDMALVGATYAAGEVNFGVLGRYARIQLPAPVTVSTFTAIVLVSKAAAGSSYETFLGTAQGTWTDFAAQVQVTPDAQSNFGGASFGTTSRKIYLTSQGYHMITVRYDGTALSYWIDDCKTDVRTIAATSVVLKDLYAGLSNLGFFLDAKIAGTMALYDRALSDAEVRTAYAWQKARAALSGLLVNRARFLVAEGDSITASGSTYFHKYLPNASPVVQGRNIAVAGSGMTELEGRATALDAMLPAAGVTTGDFILTVKIGTNYGVLTTAEFLTRYAAYLDARRARGWVVVICTILPQILPGSNTWRNVVNPILRTWVGTHCDAVVDFAANTTIGEDGDYANATYYSDGTHPTDAGQVIMETIYRPVINAIP